MNKFSIQQVAEILGQDFDAHVERLNEYSYEYYHDVYNQSIDSGLSEQEAIDRAESEESYQVEQEYNRYQNAVEKTAENILNKHNLLLCKQEDGYVVQPKTTWRDSLKEIIETINGVGYFYFHSVDEFLDSGPYGEEEGVMTHLHWVKRYPDVYGDTSIRWMIDRYMYC